MESLFDELERKLALDPSMLKRGGPRVDLSLLLFNARAEVRALWLVGDRGRDSRILWLAGRPASLTLARALQIDRA